ncbi:MAG TPA: hypothetical protein V6C88_14985 [Chroococcidiopsis sp.]
MTDLSNDPAALEITTLLTHYSFDLDGYTSAQLVIHWLRHYPANWLRAAVIEALYQGRYKAVSVDQILSMWQRRGQPRQHFNLEFERIVCGQFPRGLSVIPLGTPAATPAPAPEPPRLDYAPSGDFPLATHQPTPSPIQSHPFSPEPAREPHPAAADATTGAIAPAVSPASASFTVSSAEASTAVSKAASAATSTSGAVSRAASGSGALLGGAAKPEYAIQPFKPMQLEDINALHAGIQFKRDAAKHPIDRFTPAVEATEFYAKLKLVAQVPEPEATTPNEAMPNVELAIAPPQPETAE